MSAESILFLWDIDGTLITVGGAGERALVHAIRDTFEIDGDISEIDYAGRTDRRISHMLHEHYGISKTEESLKAFLDSYLLHLEREMKHTRMQLIDGIPELLEAIDVNPLFYQGLLTGNLRKGAEIKLRHFGIWHYFSFGAFSNLSMDRNALAGFALTEAFDATGIQFLPENIYVIGDTPHDIECGKSIRAKTVALSTGKYNARELKAHHPDYLFEAIGEAGDFLDQILLNRT